MSQILSLQFRPQTLSELYGQDKTVAAIRRHMASRPPRVWLFSGEAGSGKTTLARIMATAYQCQHAGKSNWGDPCPDCRKKVWTVHEINAAESSGVEDMERVAAIASHHPMNGLKRVVIIDECHSLSAAAWKSLLKPTEDTPEHAVWIFCTSDLRKVPAANQRRPVKYAMRTLGISEVEAFLKTYAAKASITRPLAPLFEAIHTLGVSSPGVLLQALEKYAAGCPASDSATGADGSEIATYNLCKALTDGDWPGVVRQLSDATPDSARLIRASAAGWLRKGLVSPKLRLTPKQQEAAALGLIELANAPFEDAMMLNWLYGVLWKIARRYRS